MAVVGGEYRILNYLNNITIATDFKLANILANTSHAAFALGLEKVNIINHKFLQLQLLQRLDKKWRQSSCHQKLF